MSEESTTLRAIEKINEVTGFNPDELRQEITIEQTGEVKSHLPVRAQKAWFRLKYPEGKITLSAEKIDYEKKFAIFRARIYADRNDPEDAFLSESYAIREFDERKPDISYIEWAQTAAVGRALLDAGFGLKYDHSGEIPLGLLPKKEQGQSNKQDTTGDKPAQQKPEEQKQQEQNSAGNSQKGTAQNISQPQNMVNQSKNQSQEAEDQRQPRYQAGSRQPQQSQPQIQQPSQNVQPGNGSRNNGQSTDNKQQANKLPAVQDLTYEQAKAVVVPFGDNKGKTLDDVAINHPDDLQWLATSYNGDNLLKQASRLIWEKAQKAA